MNKKVAIVCCSNAIKESYKEKVELLKQTLSNIGIETICSNCIYEKEDVFGGSALDRANELMKFYKDDSINEIFDISGGDIANGILNYLDYDIITNSSKKYWGYSDLTTIINAIYTKTKRQSVLYQIRNLIHDAKEQKVKLFENTICNNKDDLYKFDYEFIQGKQMEGTIIGGNIRCFLKLAGTEYMPDFTDKILLLESYGGTVAQIETYLWQLQQLGAFNKIKGILLGTFTQMEKENSQPTVEILLKRIIGTKIPIAKTKEIGHGTDSKAIIIGKNYTFEEFMK